MSDNPLVARAQSSTTWSTGLGLVEDARQVSDGIRNESWIDAMLGGVGGSLDVLAVAVDPRLGASTRHRRCRQPNMTLCSERFAADSRPGHTGDAGTARVACGRRQDMGHVREDP